MNTFLGHCRETMVRLGECMDRLAERGFPEKEAWLCEKMANGMYLMCLNLNRAEQIGDSREKELVFEQAGFAMKCLLDAATHYAETDDETMADGVIEGMRALHSFEGAKRLFLTYITKCQQDKGANL